MDMETVTQFSWDIVGARTDLSWLWNAQDRDNPSIGGARAGFQAAQKLPSHHLTQSVSGRQPRASAAVRQVSQVQLL